MTADNQTTAQEPSMGLRDRRKPDAYFAYGGLSVLLHWATVLIVAALALIGGPLHVALGLLFAALFLWRAVRRWANGFPRVSDQLLVLNFFERLTIIIMLVAMIVLPLTGVLLAVFQAAPISFFGLATWQPPFEGNTTGAQYARWVHGYAAWALYGAIAVHLLAAVKHIITSKDGILLRIVKPVAGGK